MRNFTEMQLSANPEDRSKTAPGHRRIDLLHVIAREGLTRRFLALLSTGETRLSNHRVPDELQIPYTCNGNRVPPLFFFSSLSPLFSLPLCLHAYRSTACKNTKTARHGIPANSEAKPYPNDYLHQAFL